jgi:hypothetical protein
VLPFEFLLEYFGEVEFELKPMFGSIGVYAHGMLMFILHEKQTTPADNGVWVATTAEHHPYLKDMFPGLRDISLFGPGPTGWQVLSATDPDFETRARELVERVVARDPAIGRPPSRRPKTNTRQGRGLRVKK